ncbi:Uroporphyrinogen-III synthase [Rubellimicrobium mesophilum DSM 19309]|uniref:Uroporphyrinogen-III synthase n=1 Tax=Rubellimicrobium mesophilum DSM 19309 TaxID=442562 RepID=A0A017HI63_9RHOB|nr:uroporphyrinogen-III synthase [Rubellimicrobium mesophilum]EYD74187.1 Uroporphyrinogen-III synthase [Rubellimicrobium mesophilum DSM 19309]
MDGTARLLLTRPEPAARRFLAACEAVRGRPIPAILSPILEIRPVEVRLAELPAALILTSENGVARAREIGLGGCPAWCVGPRTAEAARAAGFQAIEAGPDAEGLVAALLAARPEGPLLHLRGEHARGDVAERLRGAGLDAREVVAYRQDALPPSAGARAALDGAGPLVAPLFSPRSAAMLATWSPRAPLHVVAMSEAVAEAARAMTPDRLRVAPSPEAGAMVGITLDMLAALDASAA